MCNSRQFTNTKNVLEVLEKNPGMDLVATPDKRFIYIPAGVTGSVVGPRNKSFEYQIQ
jgi:hypothetical protein